MTTIQFSKKEQRGAVLIVSMLLLLIMTILGLSMSQTTTLQERMAGNARDASAAFEGAEAGLRAGENYLNSLTATPIMCSTIGDCVTLEKSALDGISISDQDDSWWTKAGTTFGTSTKDMEKLSEDPTYVVRRIGIKSGGSLTKGGAGTPHKTEYWEVSARSKGLTETSESVVQSTYVINP